MKEGDIVYWHPEDVPYKNSKGIPYSVCGVLWKETEDSYIIVDCLIWNGIVYSDGVVRVGKDTPLEIPNEGLLKKYWGNRKNYPGALLYQRKIEEDD